MKRQENSLIAICSWEILTERNRMFGFFGFFELVFGSMFLVVGLLGTIFWIWMLVDCATKERNQDNEKIVWILIILFTHFIGALLYFFVRRPKRYAEAGN